MIPGSGLSPGEGNGNPLQCSCVQNSMDTRLSDYHFSLFGIISMCVERSKKEKRKEWRMEEGEEGRRKRVKSLLFTERIPRWLSGNRACLPMQE